MIKTCWRCAYPFAMSHEHKATGHKILACANQGCNAPWHMEDVQGLEIMRKEDPSYARQWEAEKANWVAV